MPPLDAASLISWWGAGLSTLLALVKIWELWQSRLQFEIDYNFTGSTEIGNDIIVRNLSEKPFTVTHWELFTAKDSAPSVNLKQSTKLSMTPMIGESKRTPPPR